MFFGCYALSAEQFHRVATTPLNSRGFNSRLQYYFRMLRSAHAQSYRNYQKKWTKV